MHPSYLCSISLLAGLAGLFSTLPSDAADHRKGNLSVPQSGQQVRRGLDLLPLHAGRERADLLVGFGQPLEKRRQLMDAGAEFCTAERGTVMAFPRYTSEPGRCLPVRRTGSRRPGRLDTVSIGP